MTAKVKKSKTSAAKTSAAKTSAAKTSVSVSVSVGSLPGGWVVPPPYHRYELLLYFVSARDGMPATVRT